MSGRKSLPIVRVNEKEPCRSVQCRKEERKSTHLNPCHSESAELRQESEEGIHYFLPVNRNTSYSVTDCRLTVIVK